MPNQTGEFVYHREYGVGQILRILDNASQDVEIQFRDRPAITLTSFLLERSAQKLSPTGFRALGYNDPSTAAQLLIEQPIEALLRALEDFSGYKAKTEDLKDYLGPYLPDWDSWWNKTQPLLKEDPRIDASNSKLREYRLTREVRSQAEEAYLAFRFSKQRSASPGELVDRAKSALKFNDKGEILPEEHREDLLNYLKQVVYFEKFELHLRLATLVNLQESKWIEPQEFREWLKKLLERDVRLYQLEVNTSQHIIDELIKSPVDDRVLNILASGMAAVSESIPRFLLNWGLHKSDPKIITRFLTFSLSVNLPPELPEEKYSSLRSRLEYGVLLLESLPENNPDWVEILIAFRQFTDALAALPNLDSIRFLLPAFVKLAAELGLRTQDSLSKPGISVIDGIVNPDHPIAFILAIVDAAHKNLNKKDFAAQLEEQLLKTSDKRIDEFLPPIVERKWKNRFEASKQLLSLVQRLPYTTIIEQSGKIICGYASQAHLEDLAKYLPFLDQLRLIPGNWEWRDTVDSLRERIFLTMLQSQSVESSLIDQAVFNAAKVYVETQINAFVLQSESMRNQFHALESQTAHNQALLEEKEILLRELKGNYGGNSEEIRFEERSRILKELVISIAEFERFTAGQPNRSKEIEAILKRFSNILGAYKVVATESIGATVLFNPQKHRLAESADVSPGDTVSILERGYFIRDQKDKLRLLKPALVKKP